MSKRHSSRIHRIIRNITHIYCGNHISYRTCYRNLHIFTLPNNGYMCLARSHKLFLFFLLSFCVVCLFLLLSPDYFFSLLFFVYSFNFDFFALPLNPFSNKFSLSVFFSFSLMCATFLLFSTSN